MSDKRTETMKKIFDILNKSGLAHEEMISICYTTITHLYVKMINKRPQLKNAYLAVASKSTDTLIEEIDKRTEGEKIVK